MNRLAGLFPQPSVEFVGCGLDRAANANRLEPDRGFPLSTLLKECLPAGCKNAASDIESDPSAIVPGHQKSGSRRGDADFGTCKE